jgi:hypothetical protein
MIRWRALLQREIVQLNEEFGALGKQEKIYDAADRDSVWEFRRQNRES